MEFMERQERLRFEEEAQRALIGRLRALGIEPHLSPQGLVTWSITAWNIRDSLRTGGFDDSNRPAVEAAMADCQRLVEASVTPLQVGPKPDFTADLRRIAGSIPASPSEGGR